MLQKGLTWAPEVARTPAGFVMYYTLRDAASGRQCISAALAERPEGPFRDTRPRPLVCQERLGGSIDPHRFVDHDGAAYLLWKNDGNCCGLATELWAQRLDGDGLELAGKPSSLGVRNDAAWEGDLIEAPTLWRDKGTYYLFYSANDYGSARLRGRLRHRHHGARPVPRRRRATRSCAADGSAAGPGGQAVVDRRPRRPLAGLPRLGQRGRRRRGRRPAVDVAGPAQLPGRPAASRRAHRRPPGGAVTTGWWRHRAGGSAGLRRPVLVLGAVVAGLLAMRAAAPFVAPPATLQVATPTAVATPATVPVLLAEATGTSLYLGGDDGLLRVDVDRRSVRRVAQPRGAAGADNGLVGRGGVVVAVRGGMAYATSGRPGRPAVRLGPASYALASARPGRVWLVEETGNPHRWFRAREVALGRTGSLVEGALGGAARGTLPLGQRPVAGAPGGLLVHVAGAAGGLATWNPRTARLERRLAARTPLTVVAVRGQVVAWVEQSALHLGDLATGRDRAVPPPPGVDGFAAPGVFSPTGGPWLPSPVSGSPLARPLPWSTPPGPRRSGWPGRTGRCRTAAHPVWPGRRLATGSSSAVLARGSPSAPTGWASPRP